MHIFVLGTGIVGTTVVTEQAKYAGAETTTAADNCLAIGCLPHSLSITAIKAAISSKCHFVDLVGSRFTMDCQ